MPRKGLCILFAAAFCLTAGCAAPADEFEEPQSPAAAEESVCPVFTAPDEAAFIVSSAGVTDGVLEDRYGMRGTQLENGVPTLSPPLSFAGVPDGAVCLALTLTDPDAGGFVHWLASNLPVENLAENASIDLAGIIVQGLNDFGTTGYGGPTPPSGTHAYEFAVYALSAPLDLENGYSMTDFQSAIERSIIAEAALTAAYAH